MPLSGGAHLGPYVVLDFLARGGTGEVYRARDRRLGRDVAIKVLPPHVAASPSALARFEREARAVAALSHPNVLAIHDVGNDGGIAYVVLELLEGESLDMRLARGNVRHARALEIAAAISDGLAAAHAKGIVHRDLKPSNIFIGRDGHVKILDFGLCSPVETPIPEAVTFGADTGATLPGAVLGTVGYMSPEQVRGERADPRSDIFSLGCVLYEMLLGRRPFDAATGPEQLASILRDEPSFAAGEGAVPSAAEAIVTRCLAKEPDQRFQTARDLAFALRGALQSSASAPATSPAPPSPRTVRRAAWVVIAAVALLATSVFTVLRYTRAGGTGTAGEVHAIAVLPFVSRSGGTDAEYFADGVTEELIDLLGAIRGIRVTSRTSVMASKGGHETLKQIADKLGVDAIVEGSVARDGRRVRVTADLVDVSSDSPVWSETYDRETEDLLTLQSEIAETVARHLAVRLTAGDMARLRGTRRINPIAYDAYVRGRYYYNKRTEPDLLKALAEFDRALEADPTYAPAYSGLADAYSQLGYQNYMAPLDAFPKAKAAAAKSIENDETLAEPHASLGYAHLYFDWDFAAAEAEFKRAIELNPNTVTAHHFYSVLLTALLRPDEARAEIETARRLDPLSPLVATDMGFEMYYARDYDMAAKLLKDVLFLNPNTMPAHLWLGRTYQAQGKYDAALAEYQAGGPALAAWPASLASVGHLHGLLGHTAEAHQILATLDQQAQTSYVSAYMRALVYLGLGDTPQTLRYLNDALDERSNWMVWLQKDPRWDPIRNDPGFEAIRAKVGFPAAH